MSRDTVIDDFGQKHFVIRNSKGRIYVDFHVDNQDFDEHTIKMHRDALYYLINFEFDNNER